MSPDPIMDGVMEGFGVYTYCSNNPVNYTDPTGLEDRVADATEAFHSWNATMNEVCDEAYRNLRAMQNELLKADPVGYAENKDLFDHGKTDALGSEYGEASDRYSAASAIASSGVEVLNWAETQGVMGNVPTFEEMTDTAR